MEIDRVFLGWDRGVLGSVVRRLGGRSPLVVVPTGRFRRRLMGALGEGWGGRVVTVGELPERLYTPGRPGGTALQRRLAWVRVLRAFGEHSRESMAAVVPEPPEDGDVLGWWGLAGEMEAVCRDLAGGGLGPGDVEAVASERGLDIPQDGRWAALAELEEAYAGELDLGGFSDPQRERRAAVREGRCRVEGGHDAVVLVGCVDLPPLVAGMVRCVAERGRVGGRGGGRVEVLVVADEAVAAGFDDLGVIDAAWWAEREVGLEEGWVRFVEDPAELAAEAGRSAAAGARVGGVTVAVGDEATLGEAVRRAVERALGGVEGGGRVRRGTGRAVGSTPAAVALAVLGRLSGSRRMDRLGDVVRHPEIEAWLERQISQVAEAEAREEATAPWGVVERVDRYAADHLQTRVTGDFLQTSDRAAEGGLRGSMQELWRAVAELAAWAVGASGEAVVRPLPEWMPPLRETLERLYGGSGGSMAEEAAAPAATDPPPPPPSPEAREASVPGLAPLVAAMEALAALPRDRPTTPRVTPAQAAALVLTQVAAEAIPDPAPRAGDPPPIQVLGYLELQLEETERLVIAGMNESMIPGGTVGDPYLPDSLRTALGLADATRRYARDLYLLTAAVEARRGVSSNLHPGAPPPVTLLAARRTAQGDPLAASRLLLACDDATLPRRVLRFYQPNPVDDTSVETYADAKPTEPAAVDRFLIPRPVLDHPPITRLSASGFADYLACPYRFYLKHILRLESVDDRGVELDASQFGTLAHAVLARFARSPLADATDPDAMGDYLEAAAMSAAAKAYGRSRRAAIEVQLLQLRLRLRAFAHVQARWAGEGWRVLPRRAELRDSLRVSVDGVDFTITGTPDRIDHHPTRPDLGLRIIDYKTGDTARTPEAAHREAAPDGSRRWINLQLPIYLDFVRQHTLGDTPIAAGYVNLPKKLEDVGFIEAPWDETDLEDARGARDAVIRGLRSQIFWPPRPEPPRYDDGLARVCGDGII